LDFSEESVEILEEILEQYHQSMPKGLKKLFVKGIPEEKIGEISDIFGAYVGEVMIKHFGGEWRESNRYKNAIALYSADGTEIYPSAKVYNRILDGKGNNIWIYYHSLKELFTS
jgi:hypothetical protein